MQVRIGVPASFTRLCAAARQLGAPVLVSANAFHRQDSGGFHRPSPRLFSGVPVALDSAGFVAMYRYGGFPWTVAEYVKLAASYPWDWYASMDLCCEPEIAKNREEVRRRQDETVRLLHECRQEAIKQGIAPPMPVLQGWRPTEYVRCAEMMGDLPPLVGVGSVCRRDLSGDSGLLAVIDRLDRELPKETRLHCFGVKGTAIARLAGHPRLHSIDSMAWDMAARRQSQREKKPKTVAYRIGVMRDWYKRQIESLRQEAQGKDAPRDVGAKWRQVRSREKKAQGGLKQANLWLNPEVLGYVDSQKQPKENRSACVNRLLADVAQGKRE